MANRLARVLLFWPAAALIRAGVALVALSETKGGRLTIRPLLRLFCRVVLYARPLTILRESSQYATPTDDLAKLLKRQRFIAVIPCACRAGRPVCQHPAHRPHESDTCLSFGWAAVFQVGSGLGRMLTTDEAVELCERAADSGMAHHALYSFGLLAEACNCCSENCAAVRAFKGGIPEAVRPSGLVAVRGPECDGCRGRASRLCEDICPYGLAPSGAECLGCGLCARHCPNGAIRMEERSVAERSG